MLDCQHLARVVAQDTTSGIVELLRSRGAGELPHGGGRSLLDHLLETHALVRRWQQPAWLQHAALIHSVYGSDAYQRRLVAPSARAEIAAVAGARAERLAYLFCVTPRGPLLAGTHRWARGLPMRATSANESLDPPSRDELDALVLLHMANLAEQARAADGSPGRWLSRLGSLAELLDDAEELTPPPVLVRLASLSAPEESRALRVYRDAVRRGDDPGARASRFALAASLCPVIAEPCVWLAYLSRGDGDPVASREWAAQARGRLSQLGTAWDKRLGFQEWNAIIDALGRSGDQERSEAADPTAHPRALFEALVGGGQLRTGPAAQTIKPPDAAAGRRRFHLYVDGLGTDDGSRSGAVYPDLPSRPWHDPRDFPLVAFLESNYAAIRDEIVSLEAGQFHRESEGIRRTGGWDVAFLYERGRRHGDVCAACPVTTRGVESYPTIRTSAGLIYVSRMRGGTHIDPHRGPTNIRVRCHLGVRVPEGDCGIRVADETRRWEEGKCLVFDDYFEHEAWNHTGDDRLVLIVDLWHPHLSPTEMSLLEGLHNHASDYAQRLSRYWSANAAAAGLLSQDG
jgi:aspartate beta-hydroxylase